MNLIRSTRNNIFEMYNDKAAIICNGWTTVSSNKASELMERGYTLVITEQNNMLNNIVTLDKRKIRAITNNKRKIAVQSTHAIINVADYKIDIIVSTIKTEQGEQDISEKDCIEQMNDLMKYIIVLLHEGYSNQIIFDTKNSTIKCILEFKFELDTNGQYGAVNTAAYLVGQLEETANELRKT